MADAALDRLLSILVPGNESNWPSAAEAITDGDKNALLAGADGAFVRMLADSVAAAPYVDGVQVVAEAEEGNRPAFQRFLRAVYTAYYASAPAISAVTMLADDGPREESPHIDASLVARVVATQAGSRRL